MPKAAVAQTPERAQTRSPAPVVVPGVTGAPWTAADIAKLGGDLDALLARSSALRGAHVGAFAIDTRSGTTLYARRADDAFQPASTLKLLVGSVALERLGAAYRFRTQAFVRGGGLVVRASGDPTLTSGDLVLLRDALAAASVPPLDDVVVDDGRYDRVPYPAGWTWDDFGYDYAAPVSAATIDENVAQFGVTGGAKMGDDVSVSEGSVLLPPPLDCNAETAGVRSVATTSAAGSASTIDTRTTSPDCTEINGTIAPGKVEMVPVAVRNPSAHFLRVARATLHLGAGATDSRANGAPLAAVNSVATDGAAADVPVWTHDSPELRTLLGPRFWIPSDNLFGELLLKEVGFVAGGVPGSTDKGIAAEKLWLRSIGVDLTNVTLADGCGMSQYDRITPRALVAILEHDWNASNRQVVLDSLPVGGSRGTIEGMGGTASAGRVFAKTGSMMHVRGLAGYLAPRRHGAVTFAFNVDDWNGDEAALGAVRAEFASRIVTD